MNEHIILDRSPMQVFYKSLHGGLASGELGAVIGRHGVGKSSFLVHIALDRLLRGNKVLHISLSSGAEHVRSYYDEIFNSLAKAARVSGPERQALKIERNRLIHAYPNQNFTAEDLAKALDMDASVMDFRPEVVVVDNLPSGDTAAFAALARERGFSLWIVAQTHRENGNAFPQADNFSTIIALEAASDVVHLQAQKVHGKVPEEEMNLHMDPKTLLVVGEDVWDPATGPWSPRPVDCALYSGGAVGAEACFGELAEAWGIKVNFTFDGHQQARERGRYMLSSHEMSAGDVSLLYVSKRLNRTFSEGAMIRRVLQSLWHQVSRAQQVFVVGDIQDDGTVKGGTGWSVELARMWHKNLWVYDQTKQGWFHWTSDRWSRGVPVIEAPHFCGTGSRMIQDTTREALRALFERSFGAHSAEESSAS
jgi:hypothetical protein